ncbi:MAG TPA: hypothetical protein VGO09_01310, partial [Flavisolibacter sp.]|nr:hypothetical protein [Flavisolibacter sp.]
MDQVKNNNINNIPPPNGFQTINVGIVGGAGYTGGELIRLLINHPNANIASVLSRSNAGKPVDSVHQDLIGEANLLFTDDNSFLTDGSIDVLFLCAGHGEAKKFLQENKINEEVRIIDLSQDFRLKAHDSFENRKFIY